MLPPDVQLLLLHGWLSGPRVWDEVRRCLAAPAIAPELTASTHEGLAAQALAAADRGGARRLLVVGHGLGAQVACWLATAHAERIAGLVLVGPVPANGVALPISVADGFAGCGGSADAIGALLDVTSRRLTAEARAARVAEALRWSPAEVAASFELWSRGSRRLEPARIEAPTRVIASDDPILPPKLLVRQWVERVPHARLQIVHGAGHWLPVEDPEAVADAVADAVTDAVADAAAHRNPAPAR